MAKAGEKPVPSSPLEASDAFEADLKKVLRGKTLEEQGWVRRDTLTLLVPMVGIRENGQEDEYLLRLHFGYYPDWPPSALFVNPETKHYDYPADLCWLPKIEGTPEIQVHTNYQSDVYRGQLICTSVTLEFYLILHGVEEKHVWDHERQNFFSTIAAIQRGLRQPFYKGRQA